DLPRGEPCERRLLLERRGGVDSRVPGLAVPLDEATVQLRGRVPGGGDDLRGEQGEQDAVLVGRPHAAVLAQERRAGRLLAAEAHRAVEQPRHEPLEADGYLYQWPAEVG